MDCQRAVHEHRGSEEVLRKAENGLIPPFIRLLNEGHSQTERGRMTDEGERKYWTHN